jgi:hypothetical protein
MEVSTAPFVDGATLSFNDPADPRATCTIHQVESYKYLGIPIHRDLKPGHIAKVACKKAWAAHHAAERAGMRQYGLPLDSRFIAWKAFVLPHILFFLPFISSSDVPELQYMVNTSLRSITDARASPEALCAEIGLMPVEWLWAQAVAINGGRLQSNRSPLRAADLVTNFLAYEEFGEHKGWGKEYKIALFRLDLKSHWPVLNPSVLPKPQKFADLMMLEYPQAAVTALAPYRNSWIQHVKARAKACAQHAHTTWLARIDHRAHSYKSESLSALTTPPKVYVKAPWLSLRLATTIQQRLLQRRALATDLHTHTPCSHRDNEDYAESFCPICLVAPDSQEHQETMAHMLWECPHLSAEQDQLDKILAAFVREQGGLPIRKSKSVAQWKDLTDKVKLGLLMGNHISELHTLSNNYADIQIWITQFLAIADAPLTLLWKKRALLVVKAFPMWKISDTDPTAVTRLVDQD